MSDTQVVELSTIARFESLPEAEAARSLLATAGIDALVMTQDQLRVDPLKPLARPGIRLQTREADAEEARQILAAPIATDES